MGKPVIGYLGLGAIGFPICYGLYQRGYRMVLPAYRRASNQAKGFSALAPDAAAKTARMDEMLAHGAVGARSLSELVEASTVIMLCLPTSKQVEDVVLAEDGILQRAKPGTVVIDMTSADPASTRMLHGRLAEKGIRLLDAPISGGTPKAIAQTLTVMVGGERETFEQVRPILETIGDRDNVYYVGPSGCGHTLKSANNFLSACNLLAATEAILVAAKAGIDPGLAAKVISNSGGKSNAVMHTYPNLILPGNPFHFTIDLMRKDIGIFNRTAQANGVPAFLSCMAYQLWSIPADERTGEADCLELIRMYERWAKVQVTAATE